MAMNKVKVNSDSSLVESACAEDVTGLKYSTEAAASMETLLGRGAFCKRKKVH